MSERNRLRRKYLEQGYISLIINTPKTREVKGKLTDYTQCTYCGDEAKEWDHIPSFVVMERLLIDKGIDEYNRHLKLKVPSCRRCNQHLAGKVLNTLRERMTEVIKQFLL